MAVASPETLGRWFDAHAAQMVMYARQWLDADEARDAVQDVFLKTTTLRESPENVKAWLLRATRNAAINRLRSRRRRKARDAVAAASQEDWFRTRGDDLPDPLKVQQLVARLPEAQREVLVLRIWCRMTLRETADLLGRPVSTLFSQYQAALAALKDRMQSPCPKNPCSSATPSRNSRRR